MKSGWTRRTLAVVIIVATTTTTAALQTTVRPQNYNDHRPHGYDLSDGSLDSRATMVTSFSIGHPYKRRRRPRGPSLPSTLLLFSSSSLSISSPTESDVQEALDRLGMTRDEVFYARELDFSWANQVVINGTYSNDYNAPPPTHRKIQIRPTTQQIQISKHNKNNIQTEMVGDAVGVLAWYGLLDKNCQVLEIQKTDMNVGCLYLARAIRQGKLSNIRYLSIDDNFPSVDTSIGFCKALVQEKEQDDDDNDDDTSSRNDHYTILPKCEHLDIGGQFWTVEPVKILVRGFKNKSPNVLPNLKSIYYGGWMCIAEDQDDEFYQLEQEFGRVLRQKLGIKSRSLSAQNFGRSK